MSYIEEFCSCIRALGRAVDEFAPNIETNVDRLILASLGSLIEQSNAVLVLLDNNHQKSTFILIRSISESSIHLINLCYFDQDYVDRMLVNANEELRSKYQFCLDEMKPNRSEKIFYQSNIDTYSNQRNIIKHRHGWRFNKVGVKQTFILADEHEQYLAYKHICGRTHSDILSLIHDHLDDLDDFVVHIGDPLDVRDLSVAFRFASEMLISSFLTAFEYYDFTNTNMNSAVQHYELMKSEFDNLI